MDCTLAPLLPDPCVVVGPGARVAPADCTDHLRTFYPIKIRNSYFALSTTPLYYTTASTSTSFLPSLHSLSLSCSIVIALPTIS